jgi:hypothetical protein
MKKSITNRTNGADRISAALLIAFFIGMVLAPFAVDADGDSWVPACCRAHGRHHCSMREHLSGLVQNDDEQGFTVVSEKCPCAPTIPTTAHSDTFNRNFHDFLLFRSVAHPNGRAQTEAKRRISFDRSRQKRGPPAPFLSA